MTQEGFKKILDLRASLNKGLSPELKEAFPDINPVVRPEYKFQGIHIPIECPGLLLEILHLVFL